MKPEDILEAIGNVDEAYVKKAKEKKKSHKKVWIAIGSIAASVMIVCMLSIVLNGMLAEKHADKYSSDELYLAVNTVDSYNIDMEGKEYIENLCNFSAALLPKLLSEEENSCISPVSLYASLCVLYEMVDSEEKEKLEKILISDEGDVTASFNDFLERLKDLPYGNEPDYEDDGNVEMYMSMWLPDKNEEQVNEEVIKHLQELYKIDIYDDSYNIEAINNWLKANDSDSEQISGDMLVNNNPVLINQLNVDLFWEVPFEADEEGKFTLVDGSEKDVTYMTLDATKSNLITSYYVRGDNYIAVMKPLSKTNSGLVFVLPDEMVDLNKVMKEEIFNEIFATLLSTESYAKVKYKVPAFKINQLADEGMISEYLETEGISEIKISDFAVGEEIEYVSRQYNYIDVNKNGCFAGSTTADFQPLGANDTENIIELTLDRPFIYILMNNGVPFYAGAVMDPTLGI